MFGCFLNQSRLHRKSSDTGCTPWAGSISHGGLLRLGSTPGGEQRLQSPRNLDRRAPLTDLPGMRDGCIMEKYTYLRNNLPSM